MATEILYANEKMRIPKENENIRSKAKDDLVKTTGLQKENENLK